MPMRLRTRGCKGGGQLTKQLGLDPDQYEIEPINENEKQRDLHT